MKCPLNCENITQMRMDVSRFFDARQIECILKLKRALSVKSEDEKWNEASLRRWAVLRPSSQVISKMFKQS